MINLSTEILFTRQVRNIYKICSHKISLDLLEITNILGEKQRNKFLKKYTCNGKIESKGERAAQRQAGTLTRLTLSSFGCVSTQCPLWCSKQPHVLGARRKQVTCLRLAIWSMSPGVKKMGPNPKSETPQLRDPGQLPAPKVSAFSQGCREN